MSISIGTSTPSSAWETHAAWLRLRGDCPQLLDHVLPGADLAEDRAGSRDTVVLTEDRARNRDTVARTEQSSGVNIRV